VADSSSTRVLAEHARPSLGSSHGAIYQMVATALAARDIRGERFVDVGCGGGQLRAFVNDRFDRYIEVDGVRYDDFPSDAEFHELDLDHGRVPLPDGTADVAAAVETIEHLENPRALARELVRLAKPGGWIVLTTPNQRSLLSLLTLVTKGSFSAFQDPDYPAHITALLEIDFARIGAELGLVDAGFAYSHHGRLPFSAAHYPTSVSALFPRALSDNLLYIARRGPVEQGFR